MSVSWWVVVGVLPPSPSLPVHLYTAGPESASPLLSCDLAGAEHTVRAVNTQMVSSLPVSLF